MLMMLAVSCKNAEIEDLTPAVEETADSMNESVKEDIEGAMDKNEILEFIRDEYGLKIDEYVITSEGLTLSYGKAFEISLSEDGYQAVQGQLEKLCGKGYPSGTFSVPRFKHKICESLNEKTTELVFMYLTKGKDSAKTATTEFYLASDEDGSKYLYIFC